MLVIEPCYLSAGAQGLRPENIRTKGLWGQDCWYWAGEERVWEDVGHVAWSQVSGWQRLCGKDKSLMGPELGML